MCAMQPSRSQRSPGIRSPSLDLRPSSVPDLRQRPDLAKSLLAPHNTPFQTGHDHRPWQFDPDEDDPARAFLTRGPARAGLVAYQLVHALKNDLPVMARHVEHALVAEQRRAVALDEGVHELAEAHPVERPLRAEDEALHVVIVAMVMGVAVAAGRAVGVVAARPLQFEFQIRA